MSEPRKVFYIDVGDMPRAKVVELMEQVRADIRGSTLPPSNRPGLTNDIVETLAIAGSFGVPGV